MITTGAPTAPAIAKAPVPTLQAPNVEIRWQNKGLTGTTAHTLSLVAPQSTGVTWAMAHEDRSGLRALTGIGAAGMLGKSFQAPGQARTAAKQLFTSLGDLSASTHRPTYSEPRLSNREFAVGVAPSYKEPFKWYTFYNSPRTADKGVKQTLDAAKQLAKQAYEKGL